MKVIIYSQINTMLLHDNSAIKWLPNAKKQGNSLRVGDLAGNAGMSLWICLKTGAWKDHATGQSGGDLISLYASIKGISQGIALKELSSNKYIYRVHKVSTVKEKKTAINPNTKLALKIWEQGKPIKGTPAEVYIKKRNLVYSHDMPIRYHNSCPNGNNKHPAIIALMTDILTNKPCGIHRTFLKKDGSGKANLSPNKMMLGRAKNAVIRLTSNSALSNELGITEGLENGLSIFKIGISAVWVALSSAGIASFPVINNLNRLIIFSDNDKAGLEASNKCAENWSNNNKEVIIRKPHKQNTDWNDVIMGVL